MVPRCGERNVHHWAHARHDLCDPWWENETEWHRAWKNCFPTQWQEVVHTAASGERHIADVRTVHGWVLELQQSRLDPEERRSRETYYETLIWVVDATRRKSDASKLSGAWGAGSARDPLSDKRRTTAVGGALFEEWRGTRAHVLFDVGDPLRLWWLFPGTDDARAYIRHVSRDLFVRTLRDSSAQVPSEFESLVQNYIAFVALYEPPPSIPVPVRPVLHPRPTIPSHRCRAGAGSNRRACPWSGIVSKASYVDRADTLAATPL